MACWAELVRGRASDASRDWPRVRRTSEVNHEWNNNLSSSLSPPPLFAVASRASGEFSLKKRLAQSKPRVSQKFVFRLTLRIAFPLIPNLHNSADEQNAICLSALSLLKRDHVHNWTNHNRSSLCCPLDLTAPFVPVPVGKDSQIPETHICHPSRQRV